MKTTARSIFSATTALGLTAFILISVFSAGASASGTGTGIGLLAIYGLLEMAILSYGPRRTIKRRATILTVTPPNATDRDPLLVDYPSCSARARAA